MSVRVVRLGTPRLPGQGLRIGQAAESDVDWAKFARKYRTEMSAPEARHALNLLAALSHGADLSVGCYCEDEDRCHRSILRELLEENGAALR